jgi:hypothetical protein
MTRKGIKVFYGDPVTPMELYKHDYFNFIS